MLTVFMCKCGQVWDCEGTPHDECKGCGGQGRVIAEEDQKFCFDCGFPEEDCHCCPCGCNNQPERCVYASTCVSCHKKYFGNGYGCTTLPCGECLAAQKEIAHG